MSLEDKRLGVFASIAVLQGLLEDDELLQDAEFEESLIPQGFTPALFELVEKWEENGVPDSDYARALRDAMEAS